MVSSSFSFLLLFSPSASSFVLLCSPLPSSFCNFPLFSVLCSYKGFWRGAREAAAWKVSWETTQSHPGSAWELKGLTMPAPAFNFFRIFYFLPPQVLDESLNSQERPWSWAQRSTHTLSDPPPSPPPVPNSRQHVCTRTPAHKPSNRDLRGSANESCSPLLIRPKERQET